MARILELIVDKKIKYVHNINSPKGCFVNLNRNDKGEVISFITHYPSGKVVSESSDFKSSYMKNESDQWENYNEMAKGMLPKDTVKPTLENKIKRVKSYLSITDSKIQVERYESVKLYMRGFGVELTSVDKWLDDTGAKDKSGIAQHIDSLLKDIVGE